MARVVTEPCVGAKHGDCVEVCPVDCFYELGDMLIINPDDCIDCGACEAECPTSAIVPDDDAGEAWVKKAATANFSSLKNITSKSEISR